MTWKPHVTVAAVVERAGRDRHRSPLVVRCVEDYLSGTRAPLDLLVDYN